MYDTFDHVYGDYIEGALGYVEDELSIDFSPKNESLIKPKQEITLTVADTLNIIVEAKTGKLLYVYGYFPLNQLKRATIHTPQYRKGSVYLRDKIASSDNGMAFASSLDEAEPIYDDSNCVLMFGNDSDTVNVMIADDVIVGLSDGCLRALWLVLRKSK